MKNYNVEYREHHIGFWIIDHEAKEIWCIMSRSEKTDGWEPGATICHSVQYGNSFDHLPEGKKDWNG